MRFSRRIIPVLLCLALTTIVVVHLNLFRHKRAGIDFMEDLLAGVNQHAKAHAVIYVSVLPDNTEAYFAAQFVLVPLICIREAHPDSIPSDSLGLILFSKEQQSDSDEILHDKNVLIDRSDNNFRMVVYKKIP